MVEMQYGRGKDRSMEGEKVFGPINVKNIDRNNLSFLTVSHFAYLRPGPNIVWAFIISVVNQTFCISEEGSKENKGTWYFGYLKTRCQKRR